eukprot:PITA_24948
MDEGKLLGHISSKEGIHVDPSRVEVIQQIDFPRTKKEIQAFNTLKDFRVYILHSHIIAYVPNAAVKNAVVQTDPEGRRGKWIATMLECDLEIKPTKLIKGQGLARLMVESNLHALDINLIAAMSKYEEESSLIQVFEMFLQPPWYSYIVYVLQHLSLPSSITKNKGRNLKLKASKLCILNNVLYWKDPGGVLLNCLIEDEAKQVMSNFHKGDCGGHLFCKTTTKKILRASYYWPTLFLDV